MDQPAKFSFKPLRHPKSIRLLHILSSDSPGPIHATLEEHQLGQCPEFEAVSYCWGEPILSRIIYIDGFPFSITENLNSALSHLTLLDETKTLWVDTLCINQKDSKEKGVQVWIMGEIFAQAARVLVWLGNGTEATDLAMHNLEVFWQDVREHRWATPNQNCSSFLEFQPDCSDSDLDTLTQKFEGLRLYVLFVQDWWRRLWVVQEFAMAKSVLMVYGARLIDWTIPCNSIRLYLRAINKLGRGLSSPQKDIPGIGILAVTNARLTYQSALANNHFHVHIRSVLPWVLKFQKCQDDRDRAYAILGLILKNLPGAATKDFRPDYTLTVEQVYKEFTRKFVYGPMTDLPFFPPFLLQSVGLVNHSNPHIPSSLADLRRDNYLPSWSFDYRPLDVDQGARRVFESMFHQVGDPQETDSPLFTLHEGGHALILKGARNCAISRIFPNDYPDDGGLAFMKPTLLKLQRQLLEESNLTTPPKTLKHIFGHLLSNPSPLDHSRKPLDPVIAWNAFEKHILDENAEFYTTFSELQKQLQVPSTRTKGWMWTPKACDLIKGTISLPADQKLAWDCCIFIHKLLQSSIHFLTTDGHVGLAPKTKAKLIKKDTQIFALAGANNRPFMLLPWMSSLRTNYYILIGFAYLHGIDWYKDVWLPEEEAQSWDTIYVI
jgi:hypothetical protein